MNRGRLRIIRALSGAVRLEFATNSVTFTNSGKYRPCVVWNPSGDKLAYSALADGVVRIVDTIHGSVEHWEIERR